MAIVHLGHLGAWNDSISIDIFDSPASVVSVDKQHGVACVHGREGGVVAHKAGMGAICQDFIRAAIGQSFYAATKNRIEITPPLSWRHECCPTGRNTNYSVSPLSTNWIWSVNRGCCTTWTRTCAHQTAAGAKV